MQPPFSIGLLRFAKAEDERAAGTEWAKDHGHLSGNGPEALEMKGLTRPNQMVNDDVIICRLTYMKNHLFFLETFDNTTTTTEGAQSLLIFSENRNIFIRFRAYRKALFFVYCGTIFAQFSFHLHP